MSDDDRQIAGLRKVDLFLSSAPLNARVLNSTELAEYRSRRISQGWRLKFTFPDRGRRLDVLVGPNFPRIPVLVALVDRPPFLTWPHVEKDGVLCLLPSTTDVDHTAPAAVTANVLHDACELVEQLSRGDRGDDFQREFLSYWGWGIGARQRDVWSLLRPEGPSRHFHYWIGQNFYLLGETPEQLTKWLDHYGRSRTADAPTFVTGTLLWLPELPVPNAYPKLTSDVLRIAESVGCVELLDHHLNADEQPLVVLGGESGAGPCFAATIALETTHNIPPNAERHSRLTHGFRAHRMPRNLLRARRFGSAPVARANVIRADATWIHGRDRDSRFNVLRDSSITVLGCGSLGGHVAVRLAEAGVGQINLVDPETLQWPNVGRHPLSAHHVGLNKAEALAKILRRQYPHAVGFRSSNLPCEQLVAANSHILTDCNLLVSTMGNWAAEGALNAWYIRYKQPVPILYAWSEPHAVAGHAVAVDSSGCFQCGFHDNGTPKLRIDQWADETTLQEPACGALFQPYGPVEFAHIVALAAETALDCLLGRIKESAHRIWCGRRSLLDAVGGCWTDAWSAVAATRPSGGFIEDRLWLPDTHCSECTRSNA